MDTGIYWYRDRPLDLGIYGYRWEMQVITKIAVSMVVIPKRSVYGRYVIEKWIDNMRIMTP